MIDRFDRAAARDLARIAGALYLVNILAGYHVPEPGGVSMASVTLTL